MQLLPQPTWASREHITHPMMQLLSWVSYNQYKNLQTPISHHCKKCIDSASDKQLGQLFSRLDTIQSCDRRTELCALHYWTKTHNKD